MEGELTLTALSLAALALGFTHTLLGPDHYVPFAAMSRVGGWSLRKTVVITMLCGLGHVGSSVLLGSVGIACSVLVTNLMPFESARGEWAGWLLIAFGLAYFAWGVVRAVRKTPHTHWHAHTDGTVHNHEHPHEAEHLHAHEAARQRGTLTPWILFTIFFFGPCEPLIPLLMYPAARQHSGAVVLVTLLFGATTLVTMTTAVILLWLGANAVGRVEQVGFSSLLDGLLQKLRDAEHFGHAAAGLVVFSCGLAVKFGL